MHTRFEELRARLDGLVDVRRGRGMHGPRARARAATELAIAATAADRYRGPACVCARSAQLQLRPPRHADRDRDSDDSAAPEPPSGTPHRARAQPEAQPLAHARGPTWPTARGPQARTHQAGLQSSSQNLRCPYLLVTLASDILCLLARSSADIGDLRGSVCSNAAAARAPRPGGTCTARVGGGPSCAAGPRRGRAGLDAAVPPNGGRHVAAARRVAAPEQGRQPRAQLQHIRPHGGLPHGRKVHVQVRARDITPPHTQHSHTHTLLPRGSRRLRHADNAAVCVCVCVCVSHSRVSASVVGKLGV